MSMQQAEIESMLVLKLPLLGCLVLLLHVSAPCAGDQCRQQMPRQSVVMLEVEHYR